MLESTLLDVIKNLEDVYNFTPYQTKKVEQFFSIVKLGDLIYPGHLKSKLGLDIKITYQFLESLKELGFLKNTYEIYCSRCGKSKGLFLECLTDFDNLLACDFCNKNFSIFEDVIVLYKVKRI